MASGDDAREAGEGFRLAGAAAQRAAADQVEGGGDLDGGGEHCPFSTRRSAVEAAEGQALLPLRTLERGLRPAPVEVVGKEGDDLLERAFDRDLVAVEEDVGE